MTARLVTGVVSGTPDQVHTLDGKTHEGAVVIDVAEPFVLVHHTDRGRKAARGMLYSSWCESRQRDAKNAFFMSGLNRDFGIVR